MAMGENAPEQADDERYARRSFTLAPDADDVLVELHEQTGKPMSEVVCLALLGLKGNNRLLRHSLATPLNALRLKVNLLAALHQSPGDELIHREIREEFQRIEGILSPPQIPAPQK